MKNLSALVVFIFSFSVSFSQSMQPTVIGSAGSDAVFVNGSMAWTIGEVMTETYSNAGNSFTQGFHQPDTSLTISIAENPQQNIYVYPNPIIDNVIIDFSGASGNYYLEIFDVQGKALRKERITANQKQLNISFRELANGVYILNLINKETNTRNSYKINKAE